MLNALAKSKNLEIYNNNTSLYTQYVHSPLSLFVFFWTKLNEILTPFLKSNFQTTLFKKIILTNCSCVHDPLILTQKQPKVAIFDKTYFLGLKNSTGSAGGVKYDTFG